VLRHVLLEDVVLDRPLDLRERHALLLRRGGVEAEEDHRRPVDRHRRRHLAERDPLHEGLHVGERRDRHAALAHLALGPRVVGVVAHERREVERDAEPRLPLREQELEPLVGLARVEKPANWRIVHSLPR
jgi:hypothetical protein